MTNINQAVELKQNNNIDLPIHDLSVEQAEVKNIALSLWLFLIKCSGFQLFSWRSGQAAPKSDCAL